MDNVFLIPMRHKIVGMDGALKFMLFVHSGIPRIITEEQSTINPEFNCERAIEAIIACYDVAAQDFIWDHVEGTEEDDDGGDEGEAA